MDVPTFTPYSEQYKESCFQSWYAAGCPTARNKIEEILPEDEYGRKPNLDVLRTWRNADNWDLRADGLDERVNRTIEDSLVAAKVGMLEQQAKRARAIQEKGMEFLDENGFDSSSSAVQAIIRGAELERTSLGLSDAIMKLAKLTNDELMAETKKMLQKFVESGESGDVIDVAEIPDSEIEEDADDEESLDV